MYVNFKDLNPSKLFEENIIIALDFAGKKNVIEDLIAKQKKQRIAPPIPSDAPFYQVLLKKFAQQHISTGILRLFFLNA